MIDFSMSVMAVDCSLTTSYFIMEFIFSSSLSSCSLSLPPACEPQSTSHHNTRPAQLPHSPLWLLCCQLAVLSVVVILLQITTTTATATLCCVKYRKKREDHDLALNSESFITL